LDFPAAITLIQVAIIIIRMGTTGGRTTRILSHTRITVAPDTPGITVAELITATIAIIITTTIEVT
jgi:hypothetical protein